MHLGAQESNSKRNFQIHVYGVWGGRHRRVAPGLTVRSPCVWRFARCPLLHFAGDGSDIDGRRGQRQGRQLWWRGMGRTHGAVEYDIFLLAAVAASGFLYTRKKHGVLIFDVLLLHKRYYGGKNISGETDGEMSWRCECVAGQCPLFFSADSSIKKYLGDNN